MLGNNLNKHAEKCLFQHNATYGKLNNRNRQDGPVLFIKHIKTEGFKEIFRGNNFVMY